MSILRPRGEEEKIPHLQDLEGEKGWSALVCKGGRTFERTRYVLVTRKCGSCCRYQYVGGRYRPPRQGSSSFLLSVWIRDSVDPAIRKNPVETARTADEKKKRWSRPRNPGIRRLLESPLNFTLWSWVTRDDLAVAFFNVSARSAIFEDSRNRAYFFCMQNIETLTGLEKNEVYMCVLCF